MKLRRSPRDVFLHLFAILALYWRAVGLASLLFKLIDIRGRRRHSLTEMGMRGEWNIGQLAREHFGTDAYIIGFGTDHGTVADAPNWDEPVKVMKVRWSHEDSVLLPLIYSCTAWPVLTLTPLNGVELCNPIEVEFMVRSTALLKVVSPTNVSAQAHQICTFAMLVMYKGSVLCDSACRP